jgi:segregation and condensation protein B
MDDFKNRVEAILFTTGRFMDLQEIANLCGVGSVGLVKDALDVLRSDYDSRGGSLSIVEDNGKWRLNIKKEYNYLTTKLLDNTEMDRPTQETLALIAYKNPALQSEIVKMRGNTAYDHIKYLKENEFVVSEAHGRTRLLKLASKFYDYFDVVADQLKSKLDSSVRIPVVGQPVNEAPKESSGDAVPSGTEVEGDKPDDSGKAE